MYAKRKAHPKWSDRFRSLPLLLTVVMLMFVLSACTPEDAIFQTINELEDTTKMIERTSDGWRSELPKLVDALEGLESQAASDAKAIIVDTKNQVQDLTAQTIQLSDAKAQNLVAQAGVEFRCNADFVKAGVREELQYLIENLKFWQKNKQMPARKPAHAVCWINPTVLLLYPDGSGWSIDSGSSSDGNVVRVFGYNFRSDALPALELYDANGQKLRNANLQATYVTRYQVNLDFSNENFAGAQAGSTVVLQWPDREDPNRINLVMSPPAQLRLSSPVYTPASPTAQVDALALKVTVTNQGGQRSGSFDVVWKPDPSDPWVSTITRTPLNPGESVEVSFPGYAYQRSGMINSAVYLGSGDDMLVQVIAVASAPPPPPQPPVRIASAPCPESHIAVSLPHPTTVTEELNLLDGDRIRVDFAQDMAPNQLRIILQTDGKIKWIKRLVLQGGFGRELGSVKTEGDSHGPIPMTITLVEDEQMRLILHKAKFLGGVWPMYCAGDLTALPGYTTTFTWLKD